VKTNVSFTNLSQQTKLFSLFLLQPLTTKNKHIVQNKVAFLIIEIENIFMK